MPKVHRNEAGVRLYSDKDVSRLRFIKRAQKMGFSLDEIKLLLQFRESPQKAKPKVRELAHHKLEDIQHHLGGIDHTAGRTATANQSVWFQRQGLSDPGVFRRGNG